MSSRRVLNQVIKEAERAVLQSTKQSKSRSAHPPPGSASPPTAVATSASISPLTAALVASAVTGIAVYAYTANASKQAFIQIPDRPAPTTSSQPPAPPLTPTETPSRQLPSQPAAPLPSPNANVATLLASLSAIGIPRPAIVTPSHQAHPLTSSSVAAALYDPHLLAAGDLLIHYCPRTRNADWVLEHLTIDNVSYSKPVVNNGKSSNATALAGNDSDDEEEAIVNSKPRVSRKGSEFHLDPNVPPVFQATLNAYLGSGYDRGHLAPAADHRDHQESMDATFDILNISPQHPVFNRGYNQLVESYIRKLVRDPTVRSAVVVTGPLWLPQAKPGADTNSSKAKFELRYDVLGNPPLTHVPTHFFKTILLQHASDNSDMMTSSDNPSASQYTLGSFIFPNAAIPLNTPLSEFSVPLEQVELYSGYVWYDQLLGNNRLEQYHTVKDAKQLSQRRLATTSTQGVPIYPLCSRDGSCIGWRTPSEKQRLQIASNLESH